MLRSERVPAPAKAGTVAPATTAAVIPRAEIKRTALRVMPREPRIFPIEIMERGLPLRERATSTPKGLKRQLRSLLCGQCNCQAISPVFPGISPNLVLRRRQGPCVDGEKVSAGTDSRHQTDARLGSPALLNGRFLGPLAGPGVLWTGREPRRAAV